MISEHQFSTHYSSAWHTVAPLSDGFWAVENMLVDRVMPPLPSRAPIGLRAVINETAFRAFCDLQSAAGIVGRHKAFDAVDKNAPEAIAYISRFSSTPRIELHDFDEVCKKEARALSFRLLHYFPEQTATLLRPKFSGCGLLSNCEGDLIEGDCLYEIKAGDRGFRIVDLRQLLTYAALAYASRSLTFTYIGLFNPRTGVAWRKSLEDVCQAISGFRLNDLLPTLIEQFSLASASR